MDEACAARLDQRQDVRADVGVESTQLFDVTRGGVLRRQPRQVADLEAALKMKPDDFDTTQKLQVVRAKMAPPKPVVQASAPPTPVPTPEPMDPRVKIGIGAGALLVLVIIIVMITRRKSRGY